MSERRPVLKPSGRHHAVAHFPASPKNGRRRGLAPLVAAAVLVIAAGVVAGIYGVGGSAAPSSRALFAARSTPRLIGPTDPARPIRFSLTLRMREGAVNSFLRELYDPSSPRYRHFLSAGQFGARFGIGDSELTRVRAAVVAGGLSVSASFPQRTELVVSGPAGRVERFLRVRLGDFATSGGARFHAPLGHPTLPPALGTGVQGVTGLDTQPLAVALDDSAPFNGLRPADLAAAYDITPLYNQGIRGDGETIALVSFDDAPTSDLQQYQSIVGISNPGPYDRVAVNGGTSPGKQQQEVDLDTQTIRGIAPGAHIINFVAPDGTPFGEPIDAITADGRAKIVSFSYGDCEPNYPDIAQDEHSFQAAAARGITVFVSAGDNGAYDCQSTDLASTDLVTEWPASSPYAVAVGGTFLDRNPNGSYLGETAWADVLSGAGGGGGLSQTQQQPPWQRGPGVSNALSNGHRQVPDVAAVADPATGLLIYTMGQTMPVGGTSAAAPFWAASMLLVQEYAQRHGIAQLGFVSPTLYALAAGPNSPFHDVTLGGNRHYQAGPGWDYATGLGSPDVAKLATAMVAALHNGPTATIAAP